MDDTWAEIIEEVNSLCDRGDRFKDSLETVEQLKEFQEIESGYLRMIHSANKQTGIALDCIQREANLAASLALAIPIGEA